MGTLSRCLADYYLTPQFWITRFIPYTTKAVSANTLLILLYFPELTLTFCNCPPQVVKQFNMVLVTDVGLLVV